MVLSLVVFGVGAALLPLSVGWAIHDVAEPTSFIPSDSVVCESETSVIGISCWWRMRVMNASHGEITVTDRLPAGMTATEILSGLFNNETESKWQCEPLEGETVVTCVTPETETPNEFESVAAGLLFAVSGYRRFRADGRNGGRGGANEYGDCRRVVAPPPRYQRFSARKSRCRRRLNSANTGLNRSWRAVPRRSWRAGTRGRRQRTLRSNRVSAHRMALWVHGKACMRRCGTSRVSTWNCPLVSWVTRWRTERCTAAQLHEHACPPGSQVGVVGILNGKQANRANSPTPMTKPHPTLVSALYNLVPEAGYPAEFGFAFANEEVPIILSASVVHTATGYRVRVTSPGVPATDERLGSTATLFGDPGAVSGHPHQW